MTQVVVLAGGLATRLAERTRRLAKYLLPVAERPFAAWQLERLAAHGYDEALICIGHFGQQIRDSLGHGERFGLTLRYVDDGDVPLGTGGALRNALAELDDAFLVTYGDSFLPFDYAAPLHDLRSHPEAEATMTVMHNDDRWDSSNVSVVGDEVAAYRKGINDDAFDHIDYGAIAMRRSVVSRMPRGPSDLAETLTAIAQQGTMRALAVEQRFFEIGSEAGLADLEAYLGS